MLGGRWCSGFKKAFQEARGRGSYCLSSLKGLIGFRGLSRGFRV